MKSLYATGIVTGSLLVSGLLLGCSDYDPVPKSQCSSVVQHAQKVLGAMSPEYSQMMADCKGASDKERGCVMAATKKGQVAQCM
jgi:hypothetical protein